MIREIIRDVTDTLDISTWDVIWSDDSGKSHRQRFTHKHHARGFYQSLPFVNKRMERV